MPVRSNTLVPRQRQIGPVGAVARAVSGVLLVAVPVALDGIGWWDAAAALAGYPLLTVAVRPLLAAAHAPDLALTAVVLVAASALTFVTPADAESVWAWLGASLIVAALRGDAGCEVLALPNALTGRRDGIACPVYTPIDAAEHRARARRAPTR
jgi:hypothetical protein